MARNSNIPEDLGRLSYLITDKTGTLTQNEMLLKKVCTEFAIFEADDRSQDLRRILEENVEKFPAGPCNDASGPDASQVDQSVVDEGGRPKKKKKRDQGNNVRDLITALAICNNVTPVPDDPELKNVLEVSKGHEIKGRGTVQNPRSSLLAESPAMRASNLRSNNSANRFSNRKSDTKMIL